MPKNPGQICLVTEGVHKGLYAFAPDAKQHYSFATLGKHFVEFYEDVTMQKPVMHEGKKTVGLITSTYCKVVGFVD